MATKTLDLTTVCDKIWEIKSKIKKLSDQITDLEVEQKGLEADLMVQAEKAGGLTAGKGKNSSFLIAPAIVPQVSDWDRFYKYIGRMKYYHLLERRPSVTGCRELWETKGEIPGVEQFTKIRVTVKGL